MRVLDAYPWIAQRCRDVKEDHGGTFVNAACPLSCHRHATLRFWLGEQNGDGPRLLFTCWAGCDKLEILRALGCKGWGDCFPGGTVPERVKQEIVARYPYQDENKTVLYQCCRLEPGLRGRDKDFRQRRPVPVSLGGGWVWNLEGVRRVLYRLPEILSSTDPVWVVAGEKDADTLRSLGFIATTNVGGERSEWLESYSETLANRDVVIVEDRDSAGKRHACEVRGSLMDYARSLRRVIFPEKDATAFVNALRRMEITTASDLRGYILGAADGAAKWVREGKRSA